MQANFESMFREFEPTALFHYLRSFRRIRVDFESHLSASKAKVSMDNTPVGDTVMHCYFIQVRPGMMVFFFFSSLVHATTYVGEVSSTTS